MRRTLVFDLDGTLVDTLPDLTAALNRLLPARGLRPVTPEEARGMVGDGVAALVRRALARAGDPDPPDAESVIARFTEDYTAHAAECSRLFPQVPETLERLAAQGWALAVCTNKPGMAARRLLDASGVLRHFAALGAGDSFAVRKPDPRHLTATIEAAGGDLAQAVMVGDHRNDIAAARGAGLPAIFAGWGYGGAEMAEGANAVAPTMGAVPDLATTLLGPAARDAAP